MNIEDLNNIKINEETKIYDLIPDKYSISSYTVSNNGIHINFIEKQKTFNNYVNLYFNINIRDTDDEEIYYKRCFVSKEYDLIPFEIKLGLLKLIVIDLDWKIPALFYQLYEITISNYDINKFIINSLGHELLTLCPIEFLKSIYSSK